MSRESEERRMAARLAARERELLGRVHSAPVLGERPSKRSRWPFPFLVKRR